MKLNDFSCRAKKLGTLASDEDGGLVVGPVVDGDELGTPGLADGGGVGTEDAIIRGPVGVAKQLELVALEAAT